MSHCSTTKNEDLHQGPGNPKVVKADYSELLNILSVGGEVDLVPAIMTKNNQFHINTVYGASFLD
jgi:hypothetical protein